MPSFLFSSRLLRLPSVSLTGRRSRSMVEALSEHRRSRRCGSSSRRQCLSRDSTLLGRAALSLLTQILSDASHTTISACLTTSS